MSLLNPFEMFVEGTTGHHNFSRLHNEDSELHYIGKMHDEDDDPAVWVYKINVLKRWVEVVAAIFMILTCAMMGNQIGLHLTHSQHPGFRTYTVRILLMVPIYSITSYAGLHSPSNAILWAMIRDTYECVVLFSFLQYCLTYLGGPVNIARYLVAKQHSEAATILTAKGEVGGEGLEEAEEVEGEGRVVNFAVADEIIDDGYDRDEPEGEEALAELAEGAEGEGGETASSRTSRLTADSSVAPTEVAQDLANGKRLPKKPKKKVLP